MCEFLSLRLKVFLTPPTKNMSRVVKRPIFSSREKIVLLFCRSCASCLASWVDSLGQQRAHPLLKHSEKIFLQYFLLLFLSVNDTIVMYKFNRYDEF